MAKPCFYHPALAPEDTLIELSASECAHAMQSRRLSADSDVRLINGQGLRAEAIIVEASKRKVVVRVDQIQSIDRPQPEVSIAVAFPKGDRQKVMIDMLAQLGVARVIPILSRYTVNKLKDTQLDKLRRVAIEASKQSQNPWLLQIEPVASFDSLLARSEGTQAERLYYADQEGEPYQANDSIVQNQTQPLILIGPEGGFSDDEFQALKTSSAVGIGLGSHILRTETAAIAAASRFVL